MMVQKCALDNAHDNTFAHARACIPVRAYTCTSVGIRHRHVGRHTCMKMRVCMVKPCKKVDALTSHENNAQREEQHVLSCCMQACSQTCLVSVKMSRALQGLTCLSNT